MWFESLYERAALMRLDRDRRVVGLAAQPMWVHWSGGLGKHAPDFFVRYRGGGAAIVDVKPARQIDEHDAEVFGRTAELCEQGGTTSVSAISPRPSIGTVVFCRGIASTAASQRRGIPGCGTALATVERGSDRDRLTAVARRDDCPCLL